MSIIETKMTITKTLPFQKSENEVRAHCLYHTMSFGGSVL